MFRAILVPLDRSGAAEAAVAPALALAERAGAALHLATVVPALPPFGFSGAEPEGSVRWFESEGSRALGYLRDLEERIRTAAPSVEVHGHVLRGAPVPTLHAWILETGIDQVVLTPRGRSRAGRGWLGSVADGLVRAVPAPVLLWRPGEATGFDPARRAELRRILVPLDGSELAEAILPWVDRLAALFEAPLSLLAVAVDAPFLVEADLPIPAEVEAEREAELARAEDYVQRVAEGLRTSGRTVEARATRAPEAAEAILAERARLGADLIALSTHGRGGVVRMVLGSVADKLIRAGEAHVFAHLEVEDG